MSIRLATPVSLTELAERFGLALHGPDREIHGLATLAAAGPGELCFLANRQFRRLLESCRAGGVILGPADLESCPIPALVSNNPYADWARIAESLHPAPRPPPGIHPSAIVDPQAVIDPSAHIGAHSSVGPGSVIEADAVIGPGCVIADKVRIGAGSRLVGRVFLGPEVRLGRRVLVHPGAVIGADGFGLAMEGGHWRKVPQLGGVSIGDDCEIGANTTIDRGAIDDTVLGNDVRLDNQVQIAHNVVIGDHTAIAGCVGIAGSTRIGRYCMIAGASGIGGHLEICDRVVITAMSTVLNSITEPGQYGSGIPARPQRAWQRVLVHLGRLDEALGRLRRLEKKSNKDRSR